MYTKESPKWSVMIPAYNCAKYLEETLLSVIKQDPGEDLMQIEVVDDFSTKDSPEEVVLRIGKGRVKFFRHPQNIGAIKNFNSCIQRAKGELVHILHGDDWILDGFYVEIENLIKDNSSVSLYATRSFIVNENNVVISATPTLDNLRQTTKNNEDFLYSTPLQFSGVVIRKSFYLEFGMFDENLIHTADIDMWASAIYFGGGVVSNKILSGYRVFEGNDTSKLSKSGENLIDLLRLKEKFSLKFPYFNHKLFFKMVYGIAFTQYSKFSSIKDVSSATNANIFILSKLPIFFKLKFLKFLILKKFKKD
jgi:glycosyltransferase involved in cell wall biosynthesis